MNTKICWITATYFLDVDIPVVPRLKKDYDIDWYVLTSLANEKEDRKTVSENGIQDVAFKTLQFNFISPKTFLYYRRFLKEISKHKYNLYYLDISGMPYFHVLVKHYLPVDRCIIAAHNVTTPKGARYYHLAKPYMEFIVRTFNKFQVFSRNQLEVLRTQKKNPAVLYAPLCLKDYGKPTLTKPVGPISFLFFGNIVHYKRLDTLLDATKLLKEKGVTNFKVNICGYCPLQKWNDEYLPTIQQLGSIVECDIRRIPNELVANYFEQSHYFVMPYQDIAQSGAMTIAFCYNLPIIASELDTFKEFLNDGIDGLFFESGNAQALAEKMEYMITHHSTIYDTLRSNQRRMIEENLSNEAIINKYKQYIDYICPN